MELFKGEKRSTTSIWGLFLKKKKTGERSLKRRVGDWLLVSWQRVSGHQRAGLRPRFNAETTGHMSAVTVLGLSQSDREIEFIFIYLFF